MAQRAKRRRDAAESAYGFNQHGFAGHHRRSKTRYYDLKDRGLAWLAHHGHAVPAYRHGELVVWHSNNYSFHSTLSPRGIELVKGAAGAVRMEAKPAGSRDMRLVDASALLDGLPSLVSNYDRVTPPWVRSKPVPRATYDFDDDDDED